MEEEHTVEGLLVGHLGRILQVVSDGASDDIWMRQLSTSVLTFIRLVEGLSGREASARIDLEEDDPDMMVSACLDGLQAATEVAADSGLIPSRRLFIEDVTPILEAIAEERGLE